MFEKVLASTTLAACLFLSSTAVQAQLPARIDPAMQRACDAAASRYGYRVLRRDQTSGTGTTYQLPMHVRHGSTEADVTCRYDSSRRVAEVQPWDARSGRVGRAWWEREGASGLSEPQLRAEQACENSANTRRDQVTQVGTPVAHGARNWDVPLTVQRNGRQNRTVTCRYNTANGKVTMR